MVDVVVVQAGQVFLLLLVSLFIICFTWSFYEIFWLRSDFEFRFCDVWIIVAFISVLKA